MFARFGEVEPESSRAFFEDEDEEDDTLLAGSKEVKPRLEVTDEEFESRIVKDGSGYKLYFLGDDSDSDEGISDSGVNIQTYTGEALEAFIQDKKNTGSNMLAIFNGRVPVGFGKGYLGQSPSTLMKIYYNGSQGTVDSLLVRPKSKLVAEIVKAGENVLFVLLDTYAVPSSACNDICAELKIFVEASHRVVIFHSESLASFSSDLDNQVESKVFYIRNEFYKKKDIPAVAKRCPYPNLISGISGTILTHCQQIYKKPCMILVNYAPTEVVNQFTLKAFLDAVRGGRDSAISNHFSKLEFNLTSAGSSIPTHISQSNLYT